MTGVQTCALPICKIYVLLNKPKDTVTTSDDPQARRTVMAAQVKELTKEVEGWKRKYQKVKQKYNAIQRELDDIRKDNQKLSEEKDILQGVSDRYDRVVRVLGIETVDTAVQQDIQNEKVLEEKRRMEQMPKGNIHERLAWGMKKSEMENQQRKKTKSKNREMER